MSDWKDLSRLPKSEEYWQELGARVEAAALPYLTEAGHDTWLLRGGWAAVAVIAAGVVLMLTSAPDAPSAQRFLFAPKDSVAERMLSSADAPSLLEILPAFTQSERK